MNLKCWLKTFVSIILLRLYFPGIILKVITETNELEKMYDLIWQVYAMEKNYINSGQFSKEILKDEFEKYSIKIGAFLQNEIVGTLRIIPFSPVGFYVEKDFNIDLSNFPRKQISEISRLVVKQNLRNELISFGLLREAFKISKKMEIKYWIVVIPEKIKNHFSKSFGIKFYPVVEKRPSEKQLEWRKKNE